MTSPSSYGRELACLASVVLPHSRSTGPRAVRGTELHRFMCAMGKAATQEEKAEALLAVPEEWRDAAASIDWERMPTLNPETGIPELALAYDPVTGAVRELGRGGALEHDDIEELLRPGEIGGIIDWCALTPDAVYVCDWKFGWQSLDRAEVNGQLRLYGLFASKLFQKDSAIVSFCRIFDSGMVAWDIATIDAMKLDLSEVGLRQHLQSVEAAQLAYRNDGTIPKMVEGSHCTYCPAWRFCPTKTALLLSTIEQEPNKAPELARLPQPLNHDVVSRMWSKLKQAQKLVEKLQDDMREYVRLYGDVKLVSGNVLGMVETETRSIDPVFARPVLTELFGAEGANLAIRTTEKITFTSLDEVIKAHSSHGMKAKLERKVIAELEAEGAIRSVSVRTVREVSAKSKQLVNRPEDPKLTG